jgi:hypothetical protein
MYALLLLTCLLGTGEPGTLALGTGSFSARRSHSGPGRAGLSGLRLVPPPSGGSARVPTAQALAWAGTCWGGAGAAGGEAGGAGRKRVPLRSSRLPPRGAGVWVACLQGDLFGGTVGPVRAARDPMA